jgi:hypothetical protein
MVVIHVIGSYQVLLSIHPAATSWISHVEDDLE